MYRRRARNSTGTAALSAEFVSALVVFILIILFPMIDLICLTTGAATVYLTAKHCASKAGSSPTFSDALKNAESAAYQMEKSGFGEFAKLYPVHGFNDSGMDLYITETNINTNVSTRTGPNSPFVSVLDTQNCIYSYDAEVTYKVGPFVKLRWVPFIGSVPGLGRAAPLTFTASSHIEHPDGLLDGGSPILPVRQRGPDFDAVEAAEAGGGTTTD